MFAVASGKGGTGKTTVTVNLARVFSETMPVQVIDCDVEEPDVRLHLPGRKNRSVIVHTRVPVIDDNACIHCGACSSFCGFRALVVAGKMAMVFPEICHGCGGCVMVCPVQAISLTEHRVGTVEQARVNGNLAVITGVLDVGSPMAGPVIRAARHTGDPEILTLLDAPPGTSCPAVESLRNADFAILVTEPTPFGLHDLSLVVELVRLLEVPFCVVVNRHHEGDDRIHEFCRKKSIDIAITIPENRKYASAGARGLVLVDEFPELRAPFLELAHRLKKETT